MPNAHEIVWDASNAVSLAFSPTPRFWQDGICHIATYSKHAQPGFNKAGAATTTRRVRRHGQAHPPRKFHTMDDTKAKWIDDYLDRAMAAAGMSPKDGDRGTTIRIMKGEKRRPS